MCRKLLIIIILGGIILYFFSSQFNKFSNKPSIKEATKIDIQKNSDSKKNVLPINLEKPPFLKH